MAEKIKKEYMMMKTDDNNCKDNAISDSGYDIDLNKNNWPQSTNNREKSSRLKSESIDNFDTFCK